MKISLHELHKSMQSVPNPQNLLPWEFQKSHEIYTHIFVLYYGNKLLTGAEGTSKILLEAKHMDI